MQQGSVILAGRKLGPDVWQIRLSEKDRSGRRIYHKRVIGTVQQYPDAQAAREVTTALVGDINATGTLMSLAKSVSGLGSCLGRCRACRTGSSAWGKRQKLCRRRSSQASRQAEEPF